MKSPFTIGCASVVAITCFNATAKTTKPNIIYILADDLGYNELGCYGQEKIKTPNIDSIAKNGIKFTQHYSGQAVCAPARCTLLTGKHTGHSFIRDNRELQPVGQLPLPATAPSVGKMLQSKGYTTACIGKWGLGPVGSTGDPNKQGFDLFFGYNCQRRAHFYYPTYLWKNDKKIFYPENEPRVGGPNYSPDEMTKEALTFIKQSKNKPFFLYYASPLPHVSLQVTAEALEMYKDKWAEKPHRDSGHGYTGHKTPRAAYAAMISHLDRDVGRIITLLKKQGIYDNTIIMFAGDNGTTYTGGVDYKFFNSVGNLKGLKGSLWEGGIRIPMIASWPGKIKPGTVTDHISAFYDILPTFCDIVRTPKPKGIDGKSFLPTLLGRKSQKKHDYLYWEFPNRAYSGQQAIRMGKWKAIRRNLNNDLNAPIQLYDLDNDIGEKNNVADKYPKVIAKAQKIMKEARTPSKEFPLKALDL